MFGAEQFAREKSHPDNIAVFPFAICFEIRPETLLVAGRLHPARIGRGETKIVPRGQNGGREFQREKTKDALDDAETKQGADAEREPITGVMRDAGCGMRHAGCFCPQKKGQNEERQVNRPVELPGQTQIEPNDAPVNDESQFALRSRERNAVGLRAIDFARGKRARGRAGDENDFVRRFTLGIGGEAQGLA